MPQISTVILTSTSGVLNTTGNKFKGDGYYGLTDGLHTVGWYFVDFIGRIKIQGTLEQDPQSTDWFDIDFCTDPISYNQYPQGQMGVGKNLSVLGGHFSSPGRSGNILLVRGHWTVRRDHFPDHTTGFGQSNWENSAWQ